MTEFYQKKNKKKNKFLYKTMQKQTLRFHCFIRHSLKSFRALPLDMSLPWSIIEAIT